MRKVLYIMGHLADGDIEWMARNGRRIDARAGDVLIAQGVETPDLFVVLQGHVSVELAGLGIIARNGAGEILGEMSFVDKALPSATVRADGDCVLLALDKRAMLAQLASDQAFAGRFYKALAIFLADRLRDTMSKSKSREEGALDRDSMMPDELDEMVLDQVALAGIKFDHMLKTLLGARSGH